MRTSEFFTVAEIAAELNISLEDALALPKGVLSNKVAVARTRSMIEFCYANYDLTSE